MKPSTLVMDQVGNNTSWELSKHFSAELVVQMIMYCILIITGTVGNLLIMFAVLNKKPRKTSECFILNLAITDLGASTISIPLDLVERATGGFPFGSELCYILYPFQTVLMAVSVITLLLMSLERVRVVLQPFRPKLQTKGIGIAIVVSWIFPILAIIPYTLVLRLKDSQCTELWPEQWYVKIYTMAVFFIFYIIPLVVIAISYIRASVKLHQEISGIQNLLFDNSISRSQRMHSQKRALQNMHIIKVFVMAVVAFALCMLPTHMAWIWHDFGNGRHHSSFRDLLSFANIATYANSVINPIIFGTIKPSTFANIKACCLGKKTVIDNPLMLRIQYKRYCNAVRERANTTENVMGSTLMFPSSHYSNQSTRNIYESNV